MFGPLGIRHLPTPMCSSILGIVYECACDSVMSKSKSEGVAVLSYIASVFAYCACDEIDYFRSGECVMCIYMVHFFVAEL